MIIKAIRGIRAYLVSMIKARKNGLNHPHFHSQNEETKHAFKDCVLFFFGLLIAFVNTLIALLFLLFMQLFNVATSHYFKPRMLQINAK
jgi:hypothetical protein